MLPRPSLIPSEHTSVESVLLALGGYSRFQIWASFAILVPEIPAAMIAMIPVFVGSDRINQNNLTSRCQPGLTINSGNETKTAIGIECVGQHQLFGLDFSSTSVVQEWNLHGNLAWVTEMFTSVYMTGMMVGAFSASQLADSCGRKKIHYLVVLMMMIFGTACGFAPDPFTYAGLRFFSGIGVGGFYCIYSIYLMEFLTPSWRVICGSVSLWSTGEMFLALVAYNVRSWRMLSVITALPAGLMLLTYPLMPETARWLLCQNQTSKAEKVFSQIAKWNGQTAITKLAVENLQKAVQNEQSEDDQNNSTNTKNTLIVLWKNWKLRTQLLIFIFTFFTVAFTYYGISFNAKNLSGDPYLNMFYMGIVDFVAFPIGALFSNRMGRKKVYSLFLLIASVFLLILIVLETATDLMKENEIWITILCFMARFGVAGAWGVITCFAAESFPTVVRSTAVGICCLFANTGGVLAPQIAFIGSSWPMIPHVVFCTVIVIAVGLSWLLSEMTGKPLQNF